LIATLTDGDFRRAVLAGIDSPDLSPTSFLEERQRFIQTHSHFRQYPNADLLDVMRKYGLRHIPLLDESGRLVELRLWRELVLDSDLPVTAVVMAGGWNPHATANGVSPKPMLPVGERPLLEIILEQLSTSGIRHVNLTTHYKPERSLNISKMERSSASTFNTFTKTSHLELRERLDYSTRGRTRCS